MKRNPFLRIKLKYLAEEARIIRIEERRANHHKDYDLQESLHDHRVGTVRHAARCTLLAYQYLSGKPYHICENSPESVDWEQVKRMVRKYGGIELDPETWIDGELLKKAA